MKSPKEKVLQKGLMMSELGDWLWKEGVLGVNKVFSTTHKYEFHCNDSTFDELREGHAVLIKEQYSEGWDKHYFIKDNQILFFCLKKPQPKNLNDYDGGGRS